MHPRVVEPVCRGSACLAWSGQGTGNREPGTEKRSMASAFWPTGAKPMGGGTVPGPRSPVPIQQGINL